MGSRFLLSEECPVMPEVKNYLAEKATELDTTLVLRSFTNTTRMYKSNVTTSVLQREKCGCEFSEVAEDMAGRTACKMFFENGDVENCGAICLGQTAGLIDSIKPVKAIIEDIMAECYASLAKFN